MTGYMKFNQKHAILQMLTFNTNNYEISSKDKYVGDEHFAYVLDKTQKLNLAPSTMQLLLYILVKASALNLNENNRQVSISLAEYLKLSKKNNEISGRRKIHEDLSKIRSLHIRFRDNERQKDFLDMNLFSVIEGKFQGGEITTTFTPEFISYYNALPKMYLPNKIFEIDTRYNPNAFYILLTLSYFYNVNKNNKERSNTIPIKTLINYCPKLPNDYLEIKKSGQSYQRIIKPFERDMQAISNIIDWYYLDLFGNVQQMGKKSLNSFLESKIHFEFNDMPKLSNNMEI